MKLYSNFWRRSVIFLSFPIATSSCALLPHSEEAQEQALAREFPDFIVLVHRYPQNSIQSVDLANQALKEIKDQRAVLQARSEQSESDCYNKFFVNACLDELKEQRRYALARLKSIEVEANAFKRRARVAERDKGTVVNPSTGKSDDKNN